MIAVFSLLVAATLFAGVERQEALRALSYVPDSTAEVRQLAGGPAFFVDGEKTDFNAFRGDGNFTAAREIGAKIVITQFSLYRDYPKKTALWNAKEKKFEFSRLEERLLRIHVADPRARVILSVSLDPMGSESKLRPYSYASEDWIKDSDRGLAALGRWLRESPTGRIVVGFALAGGPDGRFGAWERQVKSSDTQYHADTTAALRQYLKHTYKTSEALSKAWGGTNVTFETAGMLLPNEFKRWGFHSDQPGRERRFCDCRRFYAETTARSLNRLAKSAKKSLGKQSVVLLWWTTTFSAQITRLALDELIKDRAVDILQTLRDGGESRAAGGCGTAANITAQSLRCRGILWVQELDCRLRMVSGQKKPSKESGLAEDPKSFREQTLRDAVSALAVGGQGLCFRDTQGIISKQPQMIAAIRMAYSLNAFAGANAGRYRASDVAILMDEKTKLFAESHSYATPSVAWRSSGVVPDVRLLSDVDRKDFPNYRLLVLWNPVTMTTNQASILKHRAEKGASLVAIDGVGGSSRDFRYAREALFALGPRFRYLAQANALTADKLNFLAVKAGAHVFSDPGNYIFLGNGVVYVHRRSSPVKVDFGTEVTLVDTASGKRSAPLRIWEPQLKVGESAVFCYLP